MFLVFKFSIPVNGPLHESVIIVLLSDTSDFAPKPNRRDSGVPWMICDYKYHCAFSNNDDIADN